MTTVKAPSLAKIAIGSTVIGLILSLPKGIMHHTEYLLPLNHKPFDYTCGTFWLHAVTIDH